MVELTDHERAIAKHGITTAFESDNLEVLVDDGIDIDYYNWDIQSVDRITDDGDSGYEIHFSQETYQSEKVRRKKLNPPGKAHPAEYKNHDVTIEGLVRFFPARHDGLGEATGELEQVGGIPGPPDPEPEWREREM